MYCWLKFMPYAVCIFFFVDQFFDFIIQQTSQQTSYPHQPPSIQKMQHCPVGFVCPLALICLNDKYNSITSTLIHCSHRNTDAYRCVQVVPLWHLFHHGQLANGMSARALCIHGCGMYHLAAMRCYAVGLVYHIVWGCMGYSQIAIWMGYMMSHRNLKFRDIESSDTLLSNKTHMRLQLLQPTNGINMDEPWQITMVNHRLYIGFWAPVPNCDAHATIKHFPHDGPPVFQNPTVPQKISGMISCMTRVLVIWSTFLFTAA